jgi:hypothetical protein
MRNITRSLAVLLALAGTSVRADTVDVSSMTFLTAGRQTRDGSPTLTPRLVDVVPAYELLNIAARDITNPLAQDLQIVVSSWAAYDFAHLRWDNGTDSHLTGDVVTGYVSGRLLRNMLTVRAGREQVMTGVARMLQIDGGEAYLALPFGLRLTGYAGSPVSQRFTTRSGTRSWNPTGGDLAYGGRVAYYLDLPGGVSGRGLDVGASVNVVQNGSDPVRQEAGADFRLMPIRNVTLSGFGAYSLYDDRFSEGNVALQWRAVPRLFVTADWRFVAPDLLLARNSILSVFSASRRNDVGGGLTYELARGLRVGGNYHLVLEPGERENVDTYKGHEADAKLEWERGHTALGLEAMYLAAFENGYVAGRVFGRQDYGKMFVAADVLVHRFRALVNEERSALTGSLSAGYDLAKGFSAVVSGQAGYTPFMDQKFDLMVKLAYNASYRMREVR